MKCHGCSSLMVLDKQEIGAGSCTQWHSCPLCGKVRLTSQPETNLDSTDQSEAHRHEPVEAYQYSDIAI